MSLLPRSRRARLVTFAWRVASSTWVAVSIASPLGVSTTSCAGQELVSVLPQGPTSAHATKAPASLRIRMDATGVKMPLFVSGSNVAYRDVDRALLASVEASTSSISGTLAAAQAKPIELFVELLDLHAEYSAGRLVVRMAVRATLRQQQGNTYVAQTHAHSSSSDLVAPGPGRGANVVLGATDAIGDKLADWLSGIELH